MEVSSHALELGRAEGIHFACRVFTNLTQDHLDFHDDMEDYFLAKRRLFEASRAPAVVNVDDAYGRRLAERARRTRSPTAIEREADYRAPRRELRPGRAPRSPARRRTAPLAVETRLPGLFNVQNALAAMAAARALGVPPATAAAALAERRARARPLRAGGRGPGLRRAGGLRAHARLARERAARRARADERRGCTWCSAPAATATAASAR